MQSGAPLEPSTLAGAWYRGVSLGLWGWVESLAWKTFAKTFHADGSELRGWNVRIHQDGLGAPLRPMLRAGRPRVFGHYAVVQGPDGLELDYDVVRSPRLDPGRLVRDPLVSLCPEGTLLLGRTWLQVGSRRVGTPSFFALERVGPIPREVIAAADGQA